MNISQSQQKDQKLKDIIDKLQNDTNNQLHKIYKWHNNNYIGRKRRDVYKRQELA